MVGRKKNISQMSGIFHSMPTASYFLSRNKDYFGKGRFSLFLDIEVPPILGSVLAKQTWTHNQHSWHCNSFIFLVRDSGTDSSQDLVWR